MKWLGDNNLWITAVGAIVSVLVAVVAIARFLLVERRSVGLTSPSLRESRVLRRRLLRAFWSTAALVSIACFFTMAWRKGREAYERDRLYLLGILGEHQIESVLMLAPERGDGQKISVADRNAVELDVLRRLEGYFSGGIISGNVQGGERSSAILQTFVGDGPSWDRRFAEYTATLSVPDGGIVWTRTYRLRLPDVREAQPE